MKNLYAFLLLLLAYTSNLTLAKPATPKPFHIQQGDNSTLTLYLRGDEFCHYYATMDNIPVIKNGDNSYFYAKIDNGQLVASEMMAHDPRLRSAKEISFIDAKGEVLSSKLEDMRTSSIRRARALSRANDNEDERFNHVGQKKMLIILMEFPDLQMNYSREDFDAQYNDVGYKEFNHIGSVHDYFYDQSYGNLDMAFDVVGPFIAKEKMAHYGQNDYFGNDKYIGELVTEAVMQADEYVDFKDYDWDEDGEVDQIFIIYAGYGEASGAPSNTIWPHQWLLTYCKNVGNCKGAIRLDGVLIDKYACSSELYGTTGIGLDGIGSFCHEFSHCLGLPDFYDTDYNGGIGMGFWDLMDGGCYNGPDLIGEIPTGYSAYERWKCGWLDYIELDKTTHVSDIPSISDEPIAYTIRCDKTDNEYMIVENRQNRSWFTYTGYSTQCHGLLISHVNFDKNAWANNTVNNSKNHQRMSYIPADHKFTNDSDGLEGDLFPGKYNVTELTSDSHTNVGGLWYNDQNKETLDYDQPLINISEDSGLISFDFRGKVKTPDPGITSVEIESPNSVRVQWETEEEVDFYEIEISEDPKYAFDNCIFDKNFDELRQKVIYRGLLDDTHIKRYFKLTSWHCENCYLTDDGLIMKGNLIEEEQAQGPALIKSPMLKVSGENLTIAVTYASVEEDSNPGQIPLTIYLYNGDGEIIDSQDSDLEEGTKVFHLSSGGTEEYGVVFSTDSQIKLNQIQIYDGEFSDYSLTEEGMEEDRLRPIYTESKTCADGNECFFDGLNATYYKIRMRINSYDTYSDWTDYTYVTIPTPDGILDIQPDTDEILGIYNLQGVKIDHINTSGVYIIKYPHKTVKRFIHI